MKSSCIRHPAREPLIIIRKWQVAACDGNRCAAALLSFFEYWHNVKLTNSVKAQQANDVAERHGDKPTQDTSLYQWHNSEELEDGILGLFGREKIREAIKLLVTKNFVSVHKNPEPRYHFDATNFFLFNPDAVNTFLDGLLLLFPRFAETGASIGGKSLTVDQKQPTAAQKPSPTNRETTTETSPENKSVDFSRDQFGNDIPVPFRTALFYAALQQWHAYKKERHETYKPIGAKQCLAKLVAMGSPGMAIKAIQESMGNNWQGLFLPRPESGGAGSGTRGQPRHADRLNDVPEVGPQGW